MSQAEEDAGLVGDALADLVDAGRITDADALAYMVGDKAAREKVTREMMWLDDKEAANLASEDLDWYGSLSPAEREFDEHGNELGGDW